MKQVTIITDGRPGAVADLTALLADRKINIEEMDAEVEDEHGVIVLQVDKYDEALKALRDASFRAVSEDAILIKVKDEPGALARVAASFHKAQINLRSVRIMRREKGYSLVAVVAERTDEALALVEDILVS